MTIQSRATRAAFRLPGLAKGMSMKTSNPTAAIVAVLSMVAVMLATMIAAAPANASNASGYAAQGKALGLSSAQAEALQDKVKAYEARTGGTQTAINKVSFAGGDVLVALPGEVRGRDLSVGSGGSTAGLCDYKHFCAFLYSF